jgi:hypothetical protein
MHSRALFLVLAAGIVLWTGLATAHAQQSNACADFYDAAKGDRRAADVYVSVTQSEVQSACFLIPRSVTDREGRLLYSDGDRWTFSIKFDPSDLFSYLAAKENVVVGSETRAVDEGALDCLTNPVPISIDVTSRAFVMPLTLEKISVRAKPTVTDFPGYQRYSFSKTEHYYFSDAGPDAFASFWCGRHAGVDICNVIANYDRMEASVLYARTDMPRVQVEAAQRCVRAIAKLFRMDSPDVQ